MANLYDKIGKFGFDDLCHQTWTIYRFLITNPSGSDRSTDFWSIFITMVCGFLTSVQAKKASAYATILGEFP